MEYEIKALAGMAGVSARTLRYYDQIGLLKPARVSRSGYRIYGRKEVDELQQILCYRELGIPLEEIRRILKDPGFNGEEAMRNHLERLKGRREQLDILIATVDRTLATMKGESIMTDQEKFEGFKKSLVEKNEEQYGKEVRGKYGNEVVDASNRKLMGMTPEKMKEAESLSLEIASSLQEALEGGDPASEIAQRACDLHRWWLCLYWPEGMYSKDAHLGLAEMYCQDERFKAYYEKIAPGCAEFLRDAVRIYGGE